MWGWLCGGENPKVMQGLCGDGREYTVVKIGYENDLKI